MTLSQFKERNYTFDDFERAITRVMNEMKISRHKAMNELMRYMTEHGSIDDFKEYINYFIKNQRDDT